MNMKKNIVQDVVPPKKSIRNVELPSRSRESEIDENDGDGDREPVADDGEQPRVAGVAFVDEAARRTSLDVVRPAGEQRSDSAMRTAPRHAAPERCEHESDAGMRTIAETIAHREWISVQARSM